MKIPKAIFWLALLISSVLRAQDLSTPEGLALLQVAPATGTTLTTDLVSWWGMDETTGTRKDYWSTNDLLDATSVSYQSGKITNAADFEYSDTPKDYLACADNPALSLSSDTSFSLVFWVNVESAGSTTLPIIVKATATGKDFEYGVYASGAAGPWALNFRVGNGTTFTNVATNAVLYVSTWEFCACVYDASTDKIAISINGGDFVTTTWTWGTQDTTSPCEVGRLPYSTSNTFDGLIEEIGFYKRALSLAEVQTLYNSGSGYRPF